MSKFLFVPIIIMLSFQACQNNDNSEADEMNLPEHDTTHIVDIVSDNFEKEQGVEVVQAELDFGKLLLKLESQLGWEHVEESWKDRRDNWVLDCQNAVNVQEKSDLLIEFETAILEEYQRKPWKKIQVNWLANCKKATTDNELGDYLIRLESNIKWGIVSPGWPLRRQSWIKDCQAL